MPHTVKDRYGNIQISHASSNYRPDAQRLAIVLNNLEEIRKQKKELTV